MPPPGVVVGYHRLPLQRTPNGNQGFIPRMGPGFFRANRFAYPLVHTIIPHPLTAATRQTDRGAVVIAASTPPPAGHG